LDRHLREQFEEGEKPITKDAPSQKEACW